MMSYINETDFVIENKELVYPEIVTDGLQLYYDAKGKRDTDYHRDTMLDMSGNKNHGKLHNFAYEKHSGYKDGLVFDYIDDKLTMPKLNGIDANNFTYQLNSNILAFTGDEVKTVKNGNIEVGGRNLQRDITKEHTEHMNKITVVGDRSLLIEYQTNGTSSPYVFIRKTETLHEGQEYTLSFYATLYRDRNVRLRFGLRNDGGFPDQGQTLEPEVRTKITHTFKPTKDGTPQLILFTSRTDISQSILFEDIKLEKGNAATDWTPAPEDLIKTTELKGNILGDMENIIDGLYKTEVLSGEEIYTDKADDAVVHVDVDGKSYQPNYITNLFTEKTVSGNVYDVLTGVWIEIIQGHKYYTRRTFTSDSTSGSFGSIRMLGVDTHIFTGNYQGGDYSQITEYTGSTRTGQVMFYGSSGTPAGGKIENTFIIDLTAHFGAGNEPSKNEMDELTDALGWFSGSKVYSERISESRTIPTPDYPIEIHSLNDFDVVSSQAINIFNSKDFIKNGIDNGLPETNTTLIEVDGYSGFQHRQIAWVEKYFNYLEGQFEENTSYTFSFEYDFTGDNKRSQSGIVISYTTGTNNVTTFRGLSDSGKVSMTTDPKRTVRKISIGAWGHEGSFKVWKISLIKTSDFKEFVPHTKDITEDTNHLLIDKINLSLNEPLRSVGDVKDRLFRDSDGLWKVERNIGETIVDHTLPILQGSSSSGWRTNGDTAPFYGYGGPSSRNQPSLTNKFKTSAGPGIVGSDSEGFSSGHSNFYTIRINKDRLDTVNTAGFKKWLETNPVEVLYVLSTPIIENLNQELQDKLNNLRSLEDSNYVYTVLQNENNYLSRNLKPTLHAKFLYNNWYKEDRVINNLMIYNRALTNEEMLQNYKTIKRRWRM